MQVSSETDLSWGLARALPLTGAPWELAKGVGLPLHCTCTPVHLTDFGLDLNLFSLSGLIVRL